MRWLVLLAVAVAAAPAAAAAHGTHPGAGLQETPEGMPAGEPAVVDLYAHVAHFQDFPLSTQLPQGNGSAWTAQRSACLAVPGQTFTSRQEHTWHGFLHGATVDYQQMDPGPPRLFPQPGMGWDLELDARPLDAEWHVAVQQGVHLPAFVLEARLRTGNDWSRGHAGFDAGTVMAHGRFGPMTLQPGLDHPNATHREADGQDLYTLRFAMEVLQTVVPRSEGLNVRVDAYVDNPVCADGESYLMPFPLSIHQGDGLWNRIRLHAFDVVRATLHLQYVDDRLLIHGTGEGLFGGRDVMRGMSVAIRGPTVVTQLETVQAPTFPEYAHFRAYDPVTAVWAWDPAADGAQGLYTVALRVENEQGTHNDTSLATFEFSPQGVRLCNPGTDCSVHGDGQVPAPAAMWILAGMAGMAFLRRR